MKRLKLNLDQLSEELEILDFEYLRGVKGGYGDTGGGYGDYGYYTGYGGTPDDPIELDEVEVNGGYGGYGGGDSGGGWPGWFPPAWPETGGDTGGYAPIGGGYGGYGAPTEPTGWQVAEAAANGAIGFESFYTTLDTWRTSTQPTNIGELVDDVIDKNPLASMWDDLKGVGKFKGVAILNTAGHILGVVGVAEGLMNIKDKYDAGIDPSLTDWLDLGVSVGSMFIKSNAVGMAVSFGWMVIKGNFED